MKKIIFLVGAFVLYAIIIVVSSHESPATSADDLQPMNISSYPSSGAAMTKIPDTRRVIQITYVAKNTKNIYNKLRDMTAQTNGYITRANISKRDNVYSGSMGVGTPDDKLSSAMMMLHQFNAPIESERTDTTDVSTQRIDLETRLAAAKSLEAQYLIILKTATVVTDVTSVTQRLTDIRMRIEELTQQLSVLNEDVNTVYFIFNLKQANVITQVAASWSPINDVRNASRALVSTLEYVLSGLIFLVVYLVPCVIVLMIFGYGYRRYRM